MFSTFDFTVTGMRALDSQSVQLSQGESGTYDIAIVSLIESDTSSSRVITEISGDAPCLLYTSDAADE